MLFKSCLFITFLIAAAYCNDLKDLNDLVRSGFGFKAFKSERSVLMRMMHQKCLKNADEEAFLDLKDASNETLKCMERLKELENWDKDMNTAKPFAFIQKKLKMYCATFSKLPTCLKKFAKKAKPCLSKKERKIPRAALNIIDKLLEFVCSKDARDIANFFKKGGIKCVAKNMANINQCAKSSFSMPKADNNGKYPEINLKRICGSVATFQECAVPDLETCPKPTAAKLFNDLVNVVRRAIPCNTSNAPFGRFL